MYVCDYRYVCTSHGTKPVTMWYRYVCISYGTKIGAAAAYETAPVDVNTAFLAVLICRVVGAMRMLRYM